MKKLSNFKFIFAVAILGLFASCNDDEDATLERGIKPIVTADQTSFSITEGESATVTLTTNTVYNKDMQFKLELVGGTGSFSDYTTSGNETTIDDGYGVIGHAIDFPAYATTFSFDINAILDFYPEGAETLVFRFYSMGNANGLVDAASETITVNVANGTMDDVVTVVDWSQSSRDSFGTLHAGEYLGTDDLMHEYCDYDFDLEIYDSGFGILATSYSSCPETATVFSTDPDDVYYIVPSFWTNAGPTDPAEEISFKVKVTIAKPGVWMYETNFDDVWNSTDGGADEGNPEAYQFAGILTKTGSTYLLEDLDSNVLASGKSASLKSRLPRKTSK